MTYDAISLLCGTPHPETNYELSEDGWGCYLSDGGVCYFAAGEFCDHMAACGYDRARAVPPKEMWLNSLLVLLMADVLRKRHGGPVKGAWLYRDPVVNRERKGVDKSDHLSAAGVDLWFGGGDRDLGKKQLTRVLPRVWRLFGSVESPVFEPSIGLGDSKLHLGLCARLGERFWRYG